MRKLIVSILVVLLALSNIGLAYSKTDAIEKYRVKADYLRVRDEPSGKIFYKLKYGTIVEVIEMKKGWATILYDFGYGYGESFGYVWAEYLEKYYEENDAIWIVKVSEGSRLNFRTGPSVKYSIIGKLKRGTIVTIIEIKNNWAKVIHNGQTGYVYIKYIRRIN